jgi:hypothetical protein
MGLIWAIGTAVYDLVMQIRGFWRRLGQVGQLGSSSY